MQTHVYWKLYMGWWRGVAVVTHFISVTKLLYAGPG